MTSENRVLSYRAKAAYGLLVTVSFFLLLELLLAVAGIQPTGANHDPFVGFESSIPLYVQQTHDGQPWMRTANNKLSYFNAQRFPKRKAANTTRIFCLGGSTTFGRPYNDTTSFAGWLRELLPVADASNHWEVINAGGISYASYRVAAVMEELASYSPDLFIIYTGHNEYLEERTYSDLKNSSPVIRRLNSPLFQTRTFSVIHRSLTSLEASLTKTPSNRSDRFTLPSEVDAILDHSAGPEAYHRDNLRHPEVLKHFDFNLARMVRIARSVNASVIFVTPASNLKDFSPFKSEHRSDLGDEQRQQWFRLFEKGAQHQAQGDLDQALSSFAAANRIDNGQADLHYRIAKLLFAKEEFVAARAAFQRAIDTDVCPLRATSEIQRRIERTAISHRVPLVDFDSILKDACLEKHGHGNPGSEYFLDHVHPTIETNRLLALAIIEAMRQAGSVKPDRPLQEEAIAEVSRRIESRIDADLQTRALTNLAQVLSWAGKQEEAGPLAILAVQLRSDAKLPEDCESMFYAAVSHATTGNDLEAVSLLRKVIELEPTHVGARWRLAVLLHDQGRYADALKQFHHAVRLDPQDSYSYQMLGLIFMKLERYEEAVAALNRAREIDPNLPGLRESIEIAAERADEG